MHPAVPETFYFIVAHCFAVLTLGHPGIHQRIAGFSLIYTAQYFVPQHSTM